MEVAFAVINNSADISYTSLAAGACSPTPDSDWLIIDEQICDTQTGEVGTGTIMVNEDGTLILINSATVTADGLEMNRKGDCVFIGEGSELILN